jgi:signal transduction histidine kinase
VRWVLDIPPRLPLIRADAVRLRQILTNLLANAQKMTRQGSITLGAEVAPPHLHLWSPTPAPGCHWRCRTRYLSRLTA